MTASPADYCAGQVRRLDRERYLCALFAPPEARRRLLALYAFNSEIARVRETTREALIGQMRLQWWREAIADFGRGNVRAQPVAQELAAAVSERSVRPELFERLLETREFDLDEQPPADMGALQSYAAGSSGALQQAALDLLGTRDESSDAAARHVGIAWALVGLLRATPFHARQRRIYLPADRLTAHGVDTEQLVEGRPGQGLAAVAREVADTAREHLRQARGAAGTAPRAALPALLPAWLADAYLRRLTKVGYDLFAPELAGPLPFDVVRLTIAAWRGRY